ncbi:hypothetical protein ACP4OV_002469 [Aristida adscensionis]
MARIPVPPSHLPVPAAPLLVIDPDGITQEGRTALVDPKGECHTRDIEALGSNTTFALTWQGRWILSSNPKDSRTFLYEPQTLDKIELPHFKEHQLSRQFRCAVSDKPTNDGCIVVILHPNAAAFWYCSIGGAKWIRHNYDVGSMPFSMRGLVRRKIVITHLTPCDGKFYFSISTTKYGVLEFTPHPVTRLMEVQGMPCDFMAQVCSFEMDGEPHEFLAYFYKDPSIVTSIAVYKMDVAGQRWCKLDGIGDRALLWSGSHGEGGCCSASKFGLEPNCVYSIGSEDGSMHIFDILKSTERVCDPSRDLPKLSPDAFWLLPTE